MKNLIYILIIFLLFSCEDNDKKETINKTQQTEKTFSWESANLYFLLVDRFHNGDKTNDINYNRTKKTAKLRGFEGGDIKGITKKIKKGYFTRLGINAIWLSPVVEQIQDGVDEGSGFTYAYHGYWTRDWTAIDKNFGTKEDLHELVKTAHENGIKIVLDAVLNHTGPVTKTDQVWPIDWVRTNPQCNYKDYKSAVSCTLVKNLPDILTESDEEVKLPRFLIEKWKNEGRFEQEIAELNSFFKRTGYPRASRYYIMKWLTDYITEFGIDGYRVDTVKHVEEQVWSDFSKECTFAFKQYNLNNKIENKTPFYFVGEVYGYGINGGQLYDFGDKKVNYFKNGFQSLINFDFKWNAKQLNSYEELFSKYNTSLQNDSVLGKYGLLNYISSHDDGEPFDKERKKSFETATKLLLSPGTAQIYYGDESARPLIVNGANGDANLRSLMNWSEVNSNTETKTILAHWQKLGQFRNNHISIGDGLHTMLSEKPYIFKREYNKNGINDSVVVGLDLMPGKKTINVSSVFKDGEMLRDAYSKQHLKVTKGKVVVHSNYGIVLLEKI